MTVEEVKPSRYGRWNTGGQCDCTGQISDSGSMPVYCEHGNAAHQQEFGAKPSSVSSVESTPQAELMAAATKAAQVLATIYSEYQNKIGPYASQAHKAQMRLAAAIKSNGGEL